MGTLIRITLYAMDEGRASAAMVAARHRFEELDQKLSDYKADSEINQLKSFVTTRVSEDLFAVLSFAQRVALLSGGAFDVTIGARTRGRSGTVGYQHVALGNRTVRLLKPDMQLDLGGIAKGYAADEASRVLSKQGFPRHLIAASGDVRMNDAPPGERGWRVGLGSESRMRELAHAAVSTSGNTFQPKHIWDPRTLEPVVRSETVTVIASSGMCADALATACLVLRPEERGQLLSHFPGAECIAAGQP
jgi:thiamine biosynthesis lipoprotein